MVVGFDLVYFVVYDGFCVYYVVVECFVDCLVVEVDVEDWFFVCEFV